MSSTDDLQQGWHRFCDDLKGAIDHVVDPERDVPDDERAEGVRHALRMLSMQIEQIFENDDPLHPELGWRHPAKMGQDNPDALYQTAPMDLRYSYRLSGHVGTVRSLGFAVMTWTFGEAPIRQLIELDGRDLVVDSDGRFDLTFSPDPAPDDAPEGTWHQLEPLTTRLLLRQFFADWNTEEPAVLHLECLDAEGPPPRLTIPEVVDRLGRTSALTTLMGAYWTEFGEGHLHRGEINRLDAPQREDTGDLGGTERQLYNQCMWQVEPGRALVIEFTPPECHYWELQLGDRWYQSLDYVNRLITINDAQADLDADGVCRIVVSAEDPGVNNWLDTAGLTSGYMTVRFNLAESVEWPTVTEMAFDEVEAALPTTTRRLSADERAEQIRQRRKGALTRFRR